jgi:hypothetical protein
MPPLPHPDDITHYLLECPRYDDDHRYILAQTIADTLKLPISLPNILDPPEKHANTIFTALTKYLNKTQRIKDI